MARLVAALILTVPAIAVASAALAQKGDDSVPDVAVAHLSGLQEVPTLSTSGQGRFFAEIRKDAIDYRLQYSDLESEVTQAHIHLGRVATNGGVSAFLCSNLDDPPMGTPACPVDGGVVTGTIESADVIGPEAQGIAPGEFEELLRALEKGATYVNVHTRVYPAGEIRGQIVSVLRD